MVIILFHVFMLMFIVGSFVVCIKRAFVMGREYEHKRLFTEDNKDDSDSRSN